MILRRNFLVSASAALLAPRASRSASPATISLGRARRPLIRSHTQSRRTRLHHGSLKAEGPRIVVFEAAGVIVSARPRSSFAKAISPSRPHRAFPRITFIRGGIEIGQAATNVVISHIAFALEKPGGEEIRLGMRRHLRLRRQRRSRAQRSIRTWATDEASPRQQTLWRR